MTNSASDPLPAYRDTVAGLVADGAPFALSQPGDARTRRMAGTRDSLLALFDTAVAEQGDAVMLEFDGVRRTYREVFDDAGRIAAALHADHGIAPGDRIGLAMRNGADWFPAFFAIHKLGAVAALLNSRGSGSELADAAQEVGCRLVLADERCAERLAGLSDIPTVAPADLAALAAREAATDLDRRTSGDAPALILFTSGTTGRAKGATLSHANVTCAARQLEYVGALGLAMAAKRYGVDVATLRGLMPRSTPLLIVPLYHISGIVTIITAAFGGGMVVGMPRWDAAQALDLIERNKVTQLSGPSMLLADLLALPDAATRLQSLTGVVIAGQASPIALTDRVRVALPRANQAAGWGMTELTGSVASASGPVFDAFPGTVGVPLPLADVEIRGADGTPVPTGEVGEIAVRGPTVMQGYWGRPESTAEAFDGEWLLTGDLGRFDENGLLSIVDRAKDMVISAGENIYCAEVERVLSMTPHHAEVALFGVPDERLGERAIAAIVFAADCGVTPDGDLVCAAARLHLADYKIPREVVFDLGPLPRNALGKVDKIALRRVYQERAARAALNQETRA